MVVHILLKPGESLKRHITPVDVAFYVLEGKGTIEIGDEKAEAGPDTIIESPAQVPAPLDQQWSGSPAGARDEATPAHRKHHRAVNGVHFGSASSNRPLNSPRSNTLISVPFCSMMT